ncbi:hypothetical protein Y032_0055g2536 [Ancylostoma ceylanicum]|uniref:Uncharacterized protein n=1 Tax=Ancylostoma ceylanicum TaxID=53326 RepID=A0A016U506_9BILA|nr:hypothetical protein Y032_0055g2536 [Ancylostoma ceylanicum]
MRNRKIASFVLQWPEESTNRIRRRSCSRVISLMHAASRHLSRNLLWNRCSYGTHMRICRIHRHNHSL